MKGAVGVAGETQVMAGLVAARVVEGDLQAGVVQVAEVLPPRLAALLGHHLGHALDQVHFSDLVVGQLLHVGVRREVVDAPHGGVRRRRT